MAELPECATIIGKLNQEFDDLYEENKKTLQQNKQLIECISKNLVEHSIESEDIEFEVNQMYGIIESLRNHESYDMIYYFQRYNITDPVLQRCILTVFLEKIKKLCLEREKNIFSENGTKKGFVIYLSRCNLDVNNLDLITRCVCTDPHWDSTIETFDDYNVYFEDKQLICPKSMISLENCKCQTCNCIKEKIKNLY